MKKATRKNTTKKNKFHSKRFNERFPEFNQAWDRLVREAGPELVNLLRDKFSMHSSFLQEFKNFRFKMIVDNNFVFAQIKGCIKSKTEIEHSLIYKLLISKVVKIFAPPLLEKELKEKISSLISPENHELAFSYSSIILGNITIKDAQWIDDWKKANTLIGHIDKDDIAYLALALDIESDGIISKDGVFHKQAEIQVWENNNAGKVVTNYNSGFISLVIIDQVGQVLARVVAIIFKFLRDILTQLVVLIAKITEGVIKTIVQIPPPILFALAALGIAFWEQIATYGKDIWKFLKEKANEILAKLKEVIRELSEILFKVFELAKLGGTVALEFLGFLIDEYSWMSEQVFNISLTDSQKQESKQQVAA